jgi:hypothetical protein
MRFLRIIFLLLVFSANVSAQSIVYYPFNSVLGLSTNPNKSVWIDAKFQTNTYFSSLATDISPEINLNKNPKAKVYAGAGFRFNFLNVANGDPVFEGFFINTGLRAAPFEKYKRIQLAFELSPFIHRTVDFGLFRTQLGIGYNFSK